MFTIIPFVCRNICQSGRIYKSMVDSRDLNWNRKGKF